MSLKLLLGSVSTFLAIAAAPALGLAEPANYDLLSQATMEQRPMNRRGEGLGQKLNLTDAQKQQMRSIRENTRQQIQAILSPEQRSQLQTAMSSGDRQARRGIWQRLNLTDAQKQQVRTIRENSRQQIQSVLTAEQRALMDQMRAQRMQRRGTFDNPPQN
ncbi:MAG: P pilus assembly/Cpx signaling pathway, periplasmic inhibitor/zinc-resistance associated protein [Oscillatoriales cyanobacterium SM2_2_1]|nr:P pilus assembly/Cpx signaling pathway, periplasmic inhibitor/zinc-resistance associated protein [Oscillatoriales cyanobacterium SM2_2_1]